MEKDVEIGIFGGTGIYDSGLLENAQEIDMDTPYGKPSDTIPRKGLVCKAQLLVGLNFLISKIKS